MVAEYRLRHACDHIIRIRPRRELKKDVQQDLQRVKDRRVPLGYMEGLNEARTKLAGFFSSLPPLGESVRQGGHMHLECAPRDIVNISTEGILDHGEGDLVPGNGRE